MDFDAATLAQVEAARPMVSTWLGANAGSGKTRVLTNRVARLLLARVEPQNILCLTYTKAAAGEMQNRLFATLGEWAMKPDAALRKGLEKLGESGLDDDALRRARRLFARAIETPGGLKIQTIHSFCAALLRRFPVEAGVSPQFVEMDDRTVAALIEQVVEAMADGAEVGLVDALARQMTDDALLSVCRDILGRRADFALRPSEAEIRTAMGLPEGMTAAQLVADAFAPGDKALLEQLRPVLLAGGTNDAKAGAKLVGVDFTPSLGLLAVLEDLLLTGSGAKEPFTAKTGKFPTKAGRDALGPEGSEALDQLMTRVEDARELRIGLLAAEKTLVLHRFANAFLPRVALAKQHRGWLDFDDLILKTRDLLTNPAVAQWVLFKLDGGIDHILVDEAQDTSPTQWDVIRLLAQEFTSGLTDGRERTIFVVGDQKQSIYSFQGADPREFDRMREFFGEGLAQVEKTLHSRGLAHSFRSAPAVLTAVDATFPGQTGLGAAPHHIAFKSAMPGRVDLWPTILPEKKDKTDENAEGWDPIDKIDATSPRALLAHQIAQRVRHMVDHEALPLGDGTQRRIGEGDILLLFRSRSELFYECMRALKLENLDVAGSDRIKLGEELAARDLMALLRFLALPEDDLSLATALRSPLFGWDEDRLFRLAHHRPVGTYLWAAFRTTVPDADAFAVLDDLRNQTDYLRPYELLDRILTRHRGRANLVARLGPDCEEAIDGLLQQALSYEQAEIPSLTGFLEWMDAEEVELKRQAEGAGGRIRLMTVHGAKGLEAPIVILPDCGVHQSRNTAKLLPRPGSWPAWMPSADARPKALSAALAAKAQVDTDESDRLLYVAMTRAEHWLIAASAGDLGKQTTWASQIDAGLRRAGAVEMPMPTGPGLRLANGDWTRGAEIHTETAPEPSPVARPNWLVQPAGTPVRSEKTLAPSALGGPKALAGDGADEATALRIGRQVHRLLELLPSVPAPAWADQAAQILATGEDPATPEDTDALLAEATAVLTAPALAPLFTADALPEVPLSADIPGLGRRIFGTIDRLIVSPDRVLAVDFKTNRTVPATPETVPEGLLRQMGAYAAALAAIYPDRQIETALLWTRGARLMPLPHELVLAALARANPIS